MTSFYPPGRMNRAGSSWHDPARPILLTSSKTSKTESINQSISIYWLRWGMEMFDAHFPASLPLHSSAASSAMYLTSPA